MNQTFYENYKREVRGFYWKFNEQVLKYHIHKIFNYDYLLATAKNFNTFAEFFEFHTAQKIDIIKEHCEEMFNEAAQKNLMPVIGIVEKCLIVRLGNIYTGMWIENKIYETFRDLASFIKVEQTPKEIDMNYKVDLVVELAGVDHIAIQIKPISFLSYDKGSELQCHKRYELEYGPKVYYVFYKDKNTIRFNGVEIKLDNKDEIIIQLENLLVYS